MVDERAVALSETGLVVMVHPMVINDNPPLIWFDISRRSSKRDLRRAVFVIVGYEPEVDEPNYKTYRLTFRSTADAARVKESLKTRYDWVSV